MLSGMGMEIGMINSRMRTQVKEIHMVSEGICRDYALPGRREADRPEKTDWDREREKMKGMLLPFVKETVKKQLKEEREYYHSRPSMAAKQLENIFGRENLENMLVPSVTLQVYDRLEECARREWARKGRW